MRPLVFVLLGWCALLVESALAALVPHHTLAVPELSLFIIVYLGLCGRGDAPGLCAIALSIGYLRDLYLGAPRGVETLAFCLVALAARAMHGRVFVERYAHLAVVAAAMTLLHAVVVALFGSGDAAFFGALRPLPALLASAVLLAPIVLGLLRRVDQRLQPETPSLDLSGARR